MQGGDEAEKSAAHLKIFFLFHCGNRKINDLETYISMVPQFEKRRAFRPLTKGPVYDEFLKWCSFRAFSLRT